MRNTAGIRRALEFHARGQIVDGRREWYHVSRLFSRDEMVAQARMATDMLKALAHEGRLLILCLLQDGERSVSEIEEIMDMPQAAVSQQLARLHLDGLVTARRAGRIGGEVAKRANAFGMRVVAYDPYLTPARATALTGHIAAGLKLLQDVLHGVLPFGCGAA